MAQLIDSYEKVLKILKSTPEEQCVLSKSFVEELDLNLKNLSQQSNRNFREAKEIKKGPEHGIALYTIVYVFAPEGKQ